MIANEPSVPITAQRQPCIIHSAEVMWNEFPGHHLGALSKLLVHTSTVGSRLIDHRISTYQPRAYVAPHTHKVQEQVYHVLEGEGLLEIAGKRHVVRPHDVAFIPPGVEHALYNTGLGPLTFLVITSPANDDQSRIEL